VTSRIHDIELESVIFSLVVAAAGGRRPAAAKCIDERSSAGRRINRTIVILCDQRSSMMKQ
jgi:hypothetical protein